MKNSKITELLRTFFPEELKEFEQFLKSPYFVKGRDLTKYYKLLIKFYPEFEITKNDISKKLFRGKNYSKEKMNKLIKTYNWELLKFAEEFISINFFRKDIYIRNETLLVEFLKRKLGKRAEGVFEFLDRYMKTINRDHFQFVNTVFILNSGTIAKRLVSKGNETFEIYQEESENLINFFLHHAKYLLGSISVQKGQYNPKNTSENITAFLESMDFEKYLEKYTGKAKNLVIQKMAIYNILILLYPEKFDKYFPMVKQMFEENISQIGKRDSLNYISLLLNFLSENYDRRHSNMTFEIINFALEKGIYFEEGVVGLTIFSLSKALTNALNLGEIVWAEKFVEKNIEHVIPEHRSNMLLFCKAHIEHFKGNYEVSLKHINEYKMFDEAINYKMRELQIKNFYKLVHKKTEYLETLLSAMDAFKHYIKESKKLTDKHYNTGMNFLQGLNLLINYHYSNSAGKKSDAVFKMKTFNPTTKNEWVMNEINSILNR